MTSTKSKFSLVESKITLDSTPKNTILLHSTNCFGQWGAGIALAIHERYPTADKVYEAHCDSKRPDPKSWPDRAALVGTCLLIPPQIVDKKVEGHGIWIACLFTSYGYGRPTKKKAGKDTKGKIVQQTKNALEDLRKQLEAIEAGEMEVVGNLQEDGIELKGLRPGKAEIVQSKMAIYSPKFNAGAFGVKWEETAAIVEQVFDGWNGKWFLLAPQG